MKRKSETEISTVKKIKTEPGLEETNKPKGQKKGAKPKPVKSKDGAPVKSKKGAPVKSKDASANSSDGLDITQSLTDTGVSKSKKFRFEKSGGKKVGKFKKAETPKKPNWNEFKKKKKELTKKRKMTGNSHYDVIVESKKIWEQVRRADCPDAKKTQLLNNLYKMLKDKMGQIVFSHDMSRIIQWLLKLSSPQMKKDIVKELLPFTVAMIKSKYSNALVKHMLKSGDENTKNEIIKALQPHVVTLLSHTTASPVLMYAHDQVASPAQKLAMRQELYGGLYESTGDKKINCLGDIFEQSPEMKTAILSVTKKTILKSLQKTQVTGSALLHAVLLDFISHSSDSPDLMEVLEMLAPLPLLPFVHSKAGASLKKKIVKELKGHLREVATSEFGHLVLVTLLDNVDDTLLLKKALLPELLAEVVPLANHEYGRKVIAHLVSWCDPGFFHPTCIAHVKSGDEFSTSKKDRDIRNKEILEAVSEPLLSSIAKDADFWLSTGSVAMVTAVILKNALGPGLKEAFDSVANVIVDLERRVPLELKKDLASGNKNKKQKKATQENKGGEKNQTAQGKKGTEGKREAGTEKEEETTPFIEHPGFHTVLKKLLQHDRDNVAKELPTLSESIVAKASKEVLDFWTKCNRACFILVLILESGMESCVSELKSKLSPFKTKLSSQKFSGAKVLLSKLE
ncbi:hypothetical protein M8J75_010123 [Diaphorina citri]|nr:hypothetical protein M8J75_010123 [Diaphorina citri]